MLYFVKEFKAHIEAKDEQELQQKIDKLRRRNERSLRGGRSYSKLRVIND